MNSQNWSENSKTKSRLDPHELQLGDVNALGTINTTNETLARKYWGNFPFFLSCHIYFKSPAFFTIVSCTGKSLSEALIFASTNPQYDDRLFIELQVQYVKIPNSEHQENMLCTEIVFDIQNNFCTQHVLPMYCKKEELLTKIYL